MIQADEREDLEGKRTSEVSHTERLALLYQGLFTAIVRIQSGKQELVDAVGFQKRMEGLLDEIERQAIKIGYRNQDIQDAHYAVIAFLDETVRKSSDPNRGQWTPLQAKRYGEAVAGEGVFERLKTIRIRRDSRELADLLEIYALSFLLGYQGRYAVGGRSELERIIEDLREQIERIRGHQAALSPDGALPPLTLTAPPPRATTAKWKMVAIACMIMAVAGWVVLMVILHLHAQGALGDIAP